jgi:type IV secretory pathway VirB10-like protein
MEPEPEQHAALQPEPRPEPVAPRPEPRVEAPPKPQVKPKPQPKPAPPQAVARPAPPAPQPEPAPPEPPKEEDEFLAMLRSVEEMPRQREGEVATEGTGRSRDAAGQARTELGEARLSIGEIDALRRQIGRCWTLPVGIDGIQDMVVQLRIQVRPDRTVQGVTIQDQARLGREPKFRAVAESARRAVDKCSPLNLPPGKYALWREIDMKFYPQDAISG